MDSFSAMSIFRRKNHALPVAERIVKLRKEEVRANVRSAYYIDSGDSPAFAGANKLSDAARNAQDRIRNEKSF